MSLSCAKNSAFCGGTQRILFRKNQSYNKQFLRRPPRSEQEVTLIFGDVPPGPGRKFFSACGAYRSPDEVPRLPCSSTGRGTGAKETPPDRPAFRTCDATEARELNSSTCRVGGRSFCACLQLRKGRVLLAPCARSDLASSLGRDARSCRAPAMAANGRRPRHRAKCANDANARFKRTQTT